MKRVFLPFLFLLALAGGAFAQSSGGCTISSACRVLSLDVTTNAVVHGNLTVSGTLTYTTLSVSGNATIGGTLGVTGLSTLGSLAVTTNAAITGAVTGGTLLAGTGTLSGLPYTFQSAINYDPSTGIGNSRQTMFNTTLNYSVNTTNIWEGLTSFIQVNGSGQANGEINVAHTYIQFGDATHSNTSVAAVEGYEASMQNFGNISGYYINYLAIPHNQTTGTAALIIGNKFQLNNENTATGAVAGYWAIDHEPLVGAAATAGVMTVTTANNSNQITVTGVVSGTFAVGDYLTGTGITPRSTITSLGTGTGGAGTYNLSITQTGTNVGTTVTAARYPTDYRLIRNSDPAAAISTLASIGIGSLTVPPSNTLFQITGADQQCGTVPFRVVNSGGTNLILAQNCGQVLIGGPILLGVSGTTWGKLILNNLTSGTVLLATASTGALGNQILTVPALTDTLAVLGTAQTFTKLMTYAGGEAAGGTKFTITGCAADTTVGGADAGRFTSHTAGACTVTITLAGATGITAPNSWACLANDLTTPANLISQTSSTATTCTITGTTVAGDVISFLARAY